MVGLAPRDLRISEAIGQALVIPASRMEQWKGNLFYRGVSPIEIESMSYHQMKYWNEWHSRIEKAEIEAVKARGG